MNEEYSNRFGTINQTAADMADVLEEHSLYMGGVAHLTDTGWNYLSTIYGDVPEELRASVYNDFCKELTRRGIDYDATEFCNGPGN